jgi:hypothetical protein
MKPKPFGSEAAMSRTLDPLRLVVDALGYSRWHVWQASEVEGLFGVPDHLLVFWKPSPRGGLIRRAVACELKLLSWRRALIQAYRYKAFAHYSLVVVDSAYAHRPRRAIDEFKRANVGLVAFSRNGAATWLNRPRFEHPYSEPHRRSLAHVVCLNA